jgi:NADH dehydrogenase [ubiquinone] 1 alpha subcomplex assembly factor 7
MSHSLITKKLDGALGPNQIIEHIKRNNGSIEVYDYIKLCNDFYYKNYLPFGRSGDFITSCHISSVFGEIIAISLIGLWEHMGKPSDIDLIELGPGDGLLMFDILNTFKKIKSFTPKFSIKFIDINQRFQPDYDCYFYSNMDEALSNKPTLFIGNEFFDALPIQQYCLLKNNKKEPRYVNHSYNDELSFSCEDSDVEESWVDGRQIMQSICDHVNRDNGAGIIIDYGYCQQSPKGSTLQAISKHSYVNALENPGVFDLTTHVNFYEMARILHENNICHTYETQGEFLINRGIMQRADCFSQSPEAYRQLRKAIDRLTCPTEMGGLFKVMTFFL